MTGQLKNTQNQKKQSKATERVNTAKLGPRIVIHFEAETTVNSFFCLKQNTNCSVSRGEQLCLMVYNNIFCSGNHSNRYCFHIGSIRFIPWLSKSSVPFILWGNNHYSLIGGSLSVAVWRDHRKYSSFTFLCFTFFTRSILDRMGRVYKWNWTDWLTMSVRHYFEDAQYLCS